MLQRRALGMNGHAVLWPPVSVLSPWGARMLSGPWLLLTLLMPVPSVDRTRVSEPAHVSASTRCICSALLLLHGPIRPHLQSTSSKMKLLESQGCNKKAVGQVRGP